MSASSPSICVPTAPAQPVLEVVGSTKYTFGSSYVVNLRLSFPPELGVVNRLVHLSPPGTDMKLSVQVGSATAAAKQILAFNERGIEATYSGGGDLAPARGFLAITMSPVATTTALDPIASTASNPLTLRAVVKTTVPLTPDPTGRLTLPSGTVQFFDGTLPLGVVKVTARTDGTVEAVLAKVALAVGTRSLKAVYSGDSLFTGSTSSTLKVTIK